MPLSIETEDALIDIVRRAARDQILPRFRNLAPEAISMKTGPEDLVTEADTSAEAQISAEVRALIKGVAIVGEEGCAADPSILDALATAERAVIIDPVDGTNNFAAGLSLFGVILAVVEHGETVFGLLYDPMVDDWIMARRGGGAWFCREGSVPQKLGPYEAQPVERAHGFVGLSYFPMDQRADIASRLPPYARINSLGCSCHEYRQMARGHAEFIVMPVTKPWDHAAGALIVEECGGTVTNGHGERWTPATPATRLAPITVRANPKQIVPTD